MTKSKTAAIIMDGNRGEPNQITFNFPWPQKGIETLIDIVKASKSYGINKLIVYAFSTENWSRESQSKH